jgi:D-psicose/D-tagatose/L-ribulose 3-epimerase
MRFSIDTVLFVSPFTSANTNLFKNFKRWGYQAVEILVEDPSDIDPGYVKRELNKYGLACGSICAAMNRRRDLRDGVKYLCRLLDQMVELDCPVLGGLIYSCVGRADAVTKTEYRNQWKAVVRNLKVVTKYAEERGRLVCFEPIHE